MAVFTDIDRRVWTDEEIAAAVDAGAALLDELAPGWWSEARFDTGVFDMADCNVCAAGQALASLAIELDIANGYDLACDIIWRRHGVTATQIANHGFMTPPWSLQRDWHRLEQAWLKLIEDRRSR